MEPKNSTGTPIAISKGFVIALAILGICFSGTLLAVARFAYATDLYSYILLVPLAAGYLAWQRRNALPAADSPSLPVSLTLFLSGIGALAVYAVIRSRGYEFEEEDALSLQMLSFVLLLLGTCAWFLGRRLSRALLFPLAFLVFTIPMPVALRDATESLLQQASAITALGMFRAVGETVFYQDLYFQLPNIALRVAPECSGINSSMALLITSLIAGQLFLRSNLRRAVLTLIVPPLAVLRNGFRVFTIGELCVHWDPAAIDSPIHHRGGPIFFSLSLIPFFLILYLLARSDSARGSHTP